MVPTLLLRCFLALLCYTSLSYTRALASEHLTPPPPQALRILVIAYDPQENGKTVAETFFKHRLGNQTPEEYENEQIRGYQEDLAAISNGLLQPQIVQKLAIKEFQPFPDGFTYTFESYARCLGRPVPKDCEDRKWQFDYPTWVRNNRICEIADAQNIDEIWVLSHPFVMTWENFMVGPNASFDINGGAYNMPACKRHYAFVAPTYDRADLFLHNYGHRIERTMNYLTGHWSTEDATRYWQNFSKYNISSCGNTHFPANARNAYDYGNETPQTFSCVDWANFPDLVGAKENIACNAWGCVDRGWQRYWLSNLPHATGSAVLKNNRQIGFCMKKNWWEYLANPDNAIAFRRAVRENPNTTCTPQSAEP